MEVIYEQVIDKKVENIIIRQNSHIDRGARPTPGGTKYQFFKQVDEILEDFNIKSKKRYSDTFDRISLSRVKYEFDYMMNNNTAKVIGDKLSEKLKENLNVRMVVIGLDNGKTLMFVWI